MGRKRYGRVRQFLVAVIWTIVLADPRAIFVLQVVFATIATVFALAQKFSRPTRFDRYFSYTCSLNSTAEDKMDFGQILNILSLALPLISAWESYIGKHHSCCVKVGNLMTYYQRQNPKQCTSPKSSCS
jgi:hypothetical protein